jgi:hypothetical protein
MKADAATPAALASKARFRVSSADLLYCTTVVAVYTAVTVAAFNWHPPITGSFPDRMLILAERILQGHLDSPLFKSTVDSVQIDGRYYIAVGPLQVVPYLPLAVVGGFRETAGFIVNAATGMLAGLLALPLARSFGARGADAYWVALLAAFGSLLFFVSVFGNFYFLAQAESFLALSAFLVEWAGRRRPLVLGICLAFSFLARPTTVLAAIPFGLALLWRRERALRVAFAFGLPIAFAIVAYGLFNWARFGSALQSGYAISYLPQPGLEARRALGLFSVLQVPENLRLALFTFFEPLSHAPFFTASPYGLSMVLVSPALLTALRAGFRVRDARLLWAAAALVAVPVFLYYGGGYFQYGFRYSLDFTPFLIALAAMGSGRWRGWPERLLVVASIVSVGYGILWCGNSVLRA